MTEKIEESPTATVKAERIKLEDLVTPIWDAAMGQRLATARMQRLWDQSELAEKLALNPTTLGQLEAGKLPVPRHPFSVSRLEEIFGPQTTKYILLNRYGATYDVARIRNKFIDTRFRVERKPRAPSQHWMRKRIAEGKPVRGTYQNIPHEVWNLATKLNNEREKKHSNSVKRKEKKAGN